MAKNLHRYYGAGYLHFITTSCYRRRALLDTPQSRDLRLEVMEPVRQSRVLLLRLGQPTPAFSISPMERSSKTRAGA